MGLGVTPMPWLTPYILWLDTATTGWHHDDGEQKVKLQETRKPRYGDQLWIICRIRTHRLHRFRALTPLKSDAWERYAGPVATSRERENSVATG
jgi:hypothetical protein